jgi:hypothetical protein
LALEVGFSRVLRFMPAARSGTSGIFPSGSLVIFLSVNQVFIEDMLLRPLMGWSSKAGFA